MRFKRAKTENEVMLIPTFGWLNERYYYGYPVIASAFAWLCWLPDGSYKEFARYPKFRQMYINAFERMLNECKKRGKNPETWHSGVDVFHWWMEDGVLPGQFEIEEDE